MSHTCDICGSDGGGGGLDRHHERHNPDVIEYLCVPCHHKTHRIRGLPGRPRFDATVGLTLAEARAVAVIAGIYRIDEYTALHRYGPVEDMVERVARLDAMSWSAA